jgi:hypothetical protein
MADDTEEETLPAKATSPARSEYDNARSRLKWVEDEDLSTQERREPVLSGILSFFTLGGGQLYNGQTKKGIGLVALWGLSMLVCIAADAPPAHMMALGPIAAILASWRAKQVNRFVKARHAFELEEARLGTRAALTSASKSLPAAQAQPMALPLAAGAEQQAKVVQLPPAALLPIAETSSPAAGLGVRLQKLAALRKSSVIDDDEYRARRLDAVAELKGLDTEEIENVLYDLLPLIDQGYLSREDIDFIKRLGGH